MSLLEDIQDAAIDSRSDLSVILRKCKVLAARLGSQPLEDWLLWEANGYPEDVQVPGYRIWPLTLKGHFSGAFSSGLRNAPIPLITIPERIRPQYESYQCRQSVAVLESLLKTEGNVFQVDTGDLNLILGMKVYQRMNCLQVWAEVGSASFVEVLNSVRNRILDFVLAIWKASPTAGEASASGVTRLETTQVNQLFQTTIYGGSPIVGTGGTVVNLGVHEGDLESLRGVLKQHGLAASDVEDLSKAITQDDKPESNETFGPKVSSWLSKMMIKSAEGLISTGTAAVGKLMTEAILRYYGHP